MTVKPDQKSDQAAGLRKPTAEPPPPSTPPSPLPTPGGSHMSESSDIPAPSSDYNYVPDEIILYGVRLNRRRADGYINMEANPRFLTRVPQPPRPDDPGDPGFLGALTLRLTLFRGDDPLDDEHVVIAAIYGYAYEGHCYRFDKPRVFLFEHEKIRDDNGTLLDDEDAQGCGFGGFQPSSGRDVRSYKMWRIRAKTDILELNTTRDEASAIVLENNLPGRRAPNTYEGNMRLAHRGGRLTNSGPGST
jgi:hypothetical protein